MGLPSPEQLVKLGELVAEQNARCHGSLPKFAGVMKMLAMKAGPSVVAWGVSQGAGAAGLHSGLTIATAGSFSVLSIAPIGAALTPWIGAAMVGLQSGKIFDLYDIKEDADRNDDAPVNYVCLCGKCSRNIQYIIDKKEWGVGFVALGVATFGAATIGKGVHSIGKSLYSKARGEMRPKERVSRELVESARGTEGRPGCTTAMATIFLLSGSWIQMGNRALKDMQTAVAIIISEDGWQKLKGSW